VVMVPTHISNMDSILIGYGLHALGLPPYTYGAGLNLFSNKFLGFFMRNLGAYKVDRRKKAPLYKEILKTYAGCTMEMGYHNLFFPGGTRSRSGQVESKLKKGLLGMALDAYIHNLKKNNGQQIFIVPCTLNYQLVLEAETLIEDFLKSTGKSRFIIEDDEFSQPKRVLDFVKGLFSLHSRIHWVMGAPMDVFGNKIDIKGQSIDQRGRLIDRRRYAMSQGKVVFDPLRDKEYTLELSEEIMQSYSENTVVNSTNLVSYVVFQKLLSLNPGLDFYRLLRTGGTVKDLFLPEIYSEMERILNHLKSLEADSKLLLDDSLRSKDPIFIMSEALGHLKAYHAKVPLIRLGDRLVPKNRSLLFYYQNRLASLRTFHREAL
jgi:glycerol-3-phosphate O-acyltransferase